MKRTETLIYSAAGVVVLFLALVALNYLVGAAPARVDLTATKMYTLSEGTKKTLRALTAPVKVRLYASRGEGMPVQLRGFAQRVEDLLREFQSVAGPNLVVERFDPKPDSDEEDAAQLGGVEPQQLVTGESFYLGVVVSRLDRAETIPSISFQREPLLEYDLIRAIASVGLPERPKLGVMSALYVMGTPFNPYTRGPAEPWVLANELKREFDVKQVQMDAKEIPADINVLLLIHPKHIKPETEYALDQFVLRGGKLIAFVDPYAYFDQPSLYPGMPGEPSSSTLPTLFKAWGVEMPTKVVADVVFASGSGQRYTPTVLSLNRTAFSRDDVVTSQIETLFYPFGGALHIVPAEGLKADPIVHSSTNSMLMDTKEANTFGDAALKSFAPGGKPLALAVRLSGTFKTAFPDGPPPSKDAEEDKDSDKDAKAGEKTGGEKDGKKDGKAGEKAAGGAAANPGKEAKGAGASQLKASAKPNSVVIVADVDMLADGAAVDIREVFGRKVVVPSSGNLAFALGFIEQAMAGDALMSLRSRASSLRPLTVVRELEAEAQKQYLGKIQALEDELQKTTEKLQALQKTRAPAAGGGNQILSAEEQAEIDSFRKTVATTRKELKEVRKNLRRDAEGLVFWTKVANIALMPLLVALAGLLVALVRRSRSRRLGAS
jgi:gliding motility-associatede transport system auxiliary component